MAQRPPCDELGLAIARLGNLVEGTLRSRPCVVDTTKPCLDEGGQRQAVGENGLLPRLFRCPLAVARALQGQVEVTKLALDPAEVREHVRR